MKNIFLSVVALLITLICHSQTPPGYGIEGLARWLEPQNLVQLLTEMDGNITSLKQMRLNGPVKSITMREPQAEMKFGELVRENKYSNYVHVKFDNKGNWTELYKNDTKFVLTYNEKNQLVEYNRYDVIRNGADTSLARIERGLIHYDDKGREVEALVWKTESGAPGKIDILFDSTGNSFLYGGGRDNAEYINEYRYDNKGHVIEFTRHDRNKPNIDRKDFYTYDSLGNQLSASDYRYGTEFRRKTIYNYNDKGQLTEAYQCNADGIPVDGKQLYEYDQHGNVIEEVWLGNIGTKDILSTCKYTYDSYGNWTEKTKISVKGGYASIVERSIKY